MVNPGAVFAPAFLASVVEAIEMAVIVIGVGAARGWRSSLLGAAGGAAVLAVVVVALGRALTVVPISSLRLVVGGLLLVFGLQWLRKGIRRVSANGLAGYSGGVHLEDEPPPVPGQLDWTAFVLSFKGVLLEGLEVAFIAVTFGATANAFTPAIAGAVSAVVLVGAVAVASQAWVRRIPRSVLQLVVGLLLTSFGTFWGAEGLGVEWPGSDAAILWLLLLYSTMAAVYTLVLRRQAQARAVQAQAHMPAMRRS
ncbi:MAG TPA: hypothetical protein VGP96_16820 [Candidatus Dormibacteraeota bacterium]|jgi:uncharacterized membrane protein|nr:hypothetical protein [Candidatus Dormibacteraeota bacterium]